MDEERYYGLRSAMIYLFVSVGCLWIVVMALKSDHAQLRAAFSHFVTCPRCRSGKTINEERQSKAEADHE